METIGGSQTFLYFGLGAIAFGFLHAIVQYLLHTFKSEAGKNAKKSETDNSETKPKEHLDVLKDNQDGGFKDIDLTR